jgi:integrase
MRERKVRGRVGLMASTQRVYLQLLHTVLAWGVRRKILPAVPTFPTVKVPKKKPRPVPTEAFEKLLDKAPSPTWKALLLTAWLAGLRVSETYALQWQESEEAPWLDFQQRRIWLPHKFAKADEDQWVPIDPQLQPVLEALPRTIQQVFDLRTRGGRRLALSTVCDFVSKLAKCAGVKLTMHSLRKGFGCRYAGKVPAQVLQKLMRHSDIRITMDYYANVDAAVEEAVLGPNFNSLPNNSRIEAVNERSGRDASVDEDGGSDARNSS